MYGERVGESSDTTERVETMTKKDYAIVAAVIARYTAGYSELENAKERAHKLQACAAIMAELAREFAIDNPRFTHNRFVAACGFAPLSGDK
jgi:hypothetical protein